MSETPIVPPVPADVLAQAEKDVAKVLESPEVAKVVEAPSIEEGLTLTQKFVAADKSSVVAAIVHVAVPLEAALGLHLSGGDVAILSALVSASLSYFVGLNFRTRQKLGK